MALDVGTRRIGIAVSDELGITAQGLPTLDRIRKKDDLKRLRGIARKYQVAEVVVGDPLRMSGEAGTQSGWVAEFAAELKEFLALPVHLWDERLTSAQAHRLLDETGKSRMERKGLVDEMAAVLILQSFMEARAAQAARGIE